MTFESDRLIFQSVTEEHTDELHSIFGDAVLTKYFVSGPDESIEDTENRVKQIIKHWETHDFGDFIILNKINQNIIGYGGLHYKPNGDNINISYLVKQKHWGNGYGKEIALSLMDYGFNSLRLDAIYAEIDPQNISSIKLIEKCGFLYCRKVSWKGFERIEYVSKSNK